MFVLNFLKSLAYAPTVPLLWAMIADVADHSEYVNTDVPQASSLPELSLH